MNFFFNRFIIRFYSTFPLLYYTWIKKKINLELLFRIFKKN